MSMAAQTNYGFSSSKGVAGGLYDLSAHEVTSKQAEGTGLSFGLGAVIGTNKGIDVTVPSSTAKAEDFEGVIVHNSTMVEMDMNGKVEIPDKNTVGCLHYGRIWVQTGKNAEPGYKEAVYLITDGEETGKFTTSSDSDSTSKIAVNAIFLGETDDGIANAEFRPGSIAEKED